jgi:uncharacterized hydrophobic protein (TIGR00271 family)
MIFLQKINIMNTDIKKIYDIVKGYFNAMPDKENESDTIKEISRNVVFHGANLWVLVFAIFIASLGLNVNSTAVIIGAMLISPLMGPIIGMGLAIGINDFELLKRSAKNYLVATIISIITAAVYFLLTPLDEAQSELLARTSPTLYDVLIALFGGAAGILAISTKGKGNVIPGVAIATALMPPLCTAGYGIAIGNIYYFMGAFYLFFINTVFICMSTYIGVKMLKFTANSITENPNHQRVRKYIIAIVVLTMVPATFMTVNIVKESMLKSNINHFIKNELTFSGTQIISNIIDTKNKKLTITAVGKEIGSKEIEYVTAKLSNYNLEDYKLSIIQGGLNDSIIISRLQNETTAKTNTQQLLAQAGQIKTLELQLNNYTKYEKMSNELRKEISILFPNISTIALAPATEIKIDTIITTNYITAIVEHKKDETISSIEHRKLEEWIKTRTNADSLRLIIAKTK